MPAPRSADTPHGLTMVSLGSGSKGNATYLTDGRRGFLVDAGISTKQILLRLEQLGMPDAPIDGVMVTHEHSDHIGALAILERRLIKRDGKAPITWVTEGTLRGIPPKRRPENIQVVSPGQTVTLDDWRLEAWSVPHDTPEPVAWAVEVRGQRAAVITDLGSTPKWLGQLLSGLDMAVLEFNHDEQMLMDGPYPWPLKQRIRGNHGHLSNRQAGRLLVRCKPSRLQHLFLGHLSEENNDPALALETAQVALRDAGCDHVEIHVTCQREPCGPIRLDRVVTVDEEAPARQGVLF